MLTADINLLTSSSSIMLLAVFSLVKMYKALLIHLFSHLFQIQVEV